MASEVLDVPAQEAPPATDPRRLLSRWPLLLGVAILAAPTLLSMGQQVWTREAGAHGPIVFATGIWLLWRSEASFVALARPASALLSWLLFVPGMLLYVLGRAYDFISLETAGLYGVGLAMAVSVFGVRAVRQNWFPILYLGFLIPPPEWFLDRITAPLKQFVSHVTTETLSAVGLPISREGVTIFVAQYELLVEDACSGMNSLIGLTAISLLYIHLMRSSSVRYALLLTGFVIPIAVIGNILRVMLLVLLTYFFGDSVAQGFAHEMAGVFLFAVDLLLVFAVDALLVRTVPKSWRAA